MVSCILLNYVGHVLQRVFNPSEPQLLKFLQQFKVRVLDIWFCCLIICKMLYKMLLLISYVFVLLCLEPRSDGNTKVGINGEFSCVWSCAHFVRVWSILVFKYFDLNGNAFYWFFIFNIFLSFLSEEKKKKEMDMLSVWYIMVD